MKNVYIRASEYVAFRDFVSIKKLFVGSEYASVYERMCSSVMLVYVPGVWESGQQAFTDVEDNHKKRVYLKQEWIKKKCKLKRVKKESLNDAN